MALGQLPGVSNLEMLQGGLSAVNEGQRRGIHLLLLLRKAAARVQLFDNVRSKLIYPWQSCVRTFTTVKDLGQHCAELGHSAFHVCHLFNLPEHIPRIFGKVFQTNEALFTHQHEAGEGTHI